MAEWFFLLRTPSTANLHVFTNVFPHPAYSYSTPPKPPLRFIPAPPIIRGSESKYQCRQHHWRRGDMPPHFYLRTHTRTHTRTHNHTHKHTHTHTLFSVAKRKKGNKRKKERVLKQKLLKGYRRDKNINVLAILERP